jgi:hypothetical protein
MVTLHKGLEAFLSLEFGERDRPFRTQRDARDEAMRQVGFTQAQEELRNILTQVSAVSYRDLADVRSPGQLKPMDGPGSMKLWVPPEFPVKR